MTLAAAVAQIKTWTFSGLKTNKGFDYVGVLPESELPALVLQFPLYPKLDGFAPLRVAGTSGEAIWYVEHYLLCFGGSLKRPAQRLDAIITLADAYLVKMLGDPRLNNTLSRPMDILVMPPGAVELGGSIYAGVVFLERWAVEY